MANPARPGRVRKSVKRGPGKRIVEGGSIRLADEVRISSTERPTTTDASSRLVGWSCSRPKPAMHGCSIARQRINIAQAGNFKYVWLVLFGSGVPGEIRTHGPRIRNPVFNGKLKRPRQSSGVPRYRKC